MGYFHWMVECLPKLAAAMPLLRADLGIKVLFLRILHPTPYILHSTPYT